MSVITSCRPRAAAAASRLLTSVHRPCTNAFSLTNHRRGFNSFESRPRPSHTSNNNNNNTVAGIDLTTLTDDSVVFSGIQPTGVPHIGNYFGALRQWKRMQDAAPPGAKLFFCIVDWHAITMPQDAHILMQKKAEMFAALMAVGLDPKRSTIFYQSEVPAHTELMWTLSCTASMGYLNRMTQWKSKMHLTENAEGLDADVAQKLKLGLFSYPVLQAADILVHRATHVPVGEDQKQHLEFSRECVTNFNYTYNTDCLVVPQTITTPSPRIMSLRYPERKMSKSSKVETSRISITADPDEIRTNINTAVTDSLNRVTYDPANRPGVTNLLNILAECTPASKLNPFLTRHPQDVARSMTEGGRKATLKDLKEATIQALIKELAGVRERFDDVLYCKGGKYVQELQAEGAEKARASAEETMKMVREAVGLGGQMFVAKLPTPPEFSEE